MQFKQHRRLAKQLLPRFEPTWTGQAVSATSVVAVLPPVFTTPDTNPVQSTTSLSTQAQAPAPTTSTSTTTTQLTTSSSTPVASVVSASSTSSTLSSSTESTTSSTSSTSSSSSSSSTPAQTSAAQQTTSPVTSNAVAQATATPTVTRNVVTTNSKGVVITSIVSITQSSTASATSTATPSTGSAGTIVGAVAGAFVGVICLIAFVSWIVRQHQKRKSGNHDDFDRQSYLRNSMMIPDEPGAGHPVIGTQAALALARKNTVGPRPPTMIERKPTFLPNGQPSPSFQPGQFVSFESGQVVSAPPHDGSYPSPMAFASYTPPAQHHQSELSRRPSGARLLMRQPTNGGMYDNAQFPHAPPPVPDNYPHDGYMHPMQPGSPNRGMILSVTPYQAQQYAEITRQLEASGFEQDDSFHPITPVGSRGDQANGGADKSLPNPFDERAGSTPPSLPPVDRTGTPIDPNPQHAHWSYDAKGQAPGSRLSVAGLPAPVTNAPAVPPAAYTREERTVVVGNGEAHNAKRPVSLVDTDDAYGGI